MGYDDLFLQIEILVFSDGRKEVYSWKIVKTKIFSELTKKAAEGNVSKKKCSCFHDCSQVFGYLKKSCATH